MLPFFEIAVYQCAKCSPLVRDHFATRSPQDCRDRTRQIDIRTMSVIVNDDNHVKEGAATEEADGSATEGTVSVGARQGTYYYAFGDKASDANFQAPQRITKEEALKKEIDMKAGVSKWNANNYHWEEKNLMPWAEAFLSELYAEQIELSWTEERHC